MNIYRHKESKKPYSLRHLIVDMNYANNNEFAGIYVYPYKHNGDIIRFLKKDHACCENFVFENFEVWYEI